MSATLTTAISQKSAISLLTNGTSLAHRPPELRSRGTEFSIHLDGETKEAIIELQLINELCKQFKSFSTTQKKKFLYEFLKICSYESLKEFKTFLEPLLHRDFCINAESDYPAWIKMNEKYRIIFSQAETRRIKNTPYSIPSFLIPMMREPSEDKLKSAVSSKIQSGNQRKLPSRAQSKNTRASYRIPSHISMRTPLVGQSRQAPRQRQPTGTFKAVLISNQIPKPKNTSHSTLRRPIFSRDQSKASLKHETNSNIKRSAQFIKHSHADVNQKTEPKVIKSIDTFIADKQISMAKKSWNLNEELFRTKKAINTNSLIGKMKALFKRKYDTREERIKRLSIVGNVEKIEPNKSSSTKKSTSADDAESSIYVKKLKNNFYDRKLWKSLDLFEQKNTLNLFIESERVYTNDFAILKRNDWTQSNFGKTISKFKQLPCIQPSAEIKLASENSTFDFNYPQSSQSHKKHSQMLVKREDFLKICESNFKIIQNWTHTRHITLLCALLKYCNNNILQYIKEDVIQRLEGNNITIHSLPDNILIFIFAKLDFESLEQVPLVCQRWNYLANTSELWIYKCRQMSQREKLFDIDNLIFNELKEDEDIDWKQAYYELEEFSRKIKQDYLQEISELTQAKEINLNEESLMSMKSKRSGKATPVSSRRSSLTHDDSKKMSIISMRSRANSYVNFYVDKKFKKIKQPIRKSSLTEQNLRLYSRLSKDKSRASSRSSQSSRGSLKGNVKFNESQLLDEYSFNNSETSDDENDRSTRQKLAQKKLRPFEIKISEEIQENKTDLNQSKDLLGKIVPACKLRWRAEGEGLEDLKSSEKIHFNIKKIIQVREIHSHSEGVTCMDTDKRRLITGSMDRTICIFDVRNGTFIKRLDGHKGGIRCVQLFLNRLCSGSWDSTLIIWNLINYQLVHTIYDFAGTVSCLQFNIHLLIAGSHDKSIRIWHFDKNYREDADNVIASKEIIQFQRVISHHRAPVVALRYDGLKSIISADSSGSILVGDLNGNLANVLKHDHLVEPITSLRLVGALAITSTSNGKVLFWNRFSNECEAAIRCHINVSINAIDYFDGRLYTAGADGCIKEWDLSTLTCLREIKTHEGAVCDVKANDIRIISCGSDGLIKIWEMTTPINKLPKDAILS